MTTIRSISLEGSSLNSLGRDATTTRSLISLAAAGFVSVDGDQVVLTPKGKKAKKRSDKAELRESHKECVLKALANVPKDSRGLSLSKPIHFRAAVEASKVGVTSITRTDVLDSLRDLRDEGRVQSIRTSRSNFGVRWKIHPRFAV